MKNKLYLISIILLLLLYSCSRTPNYVSLDYLNYQKDTIDGITDAGGTVGLFKCFDFTYSDGYNMFYLIPKSNRWEWHLQKSKEDSWQNNNYANSFNHTVECLNQHSLAELSSQLNIYIYHIPMQYLDEDTLYQLSYAKIRPRKVYIYHLDFVNNKIDTVDSILIETALDESKYSGGNWLKSFTDKISPMMPSDYPDFHIRRCSIDDLQNAQYIDSLDVDVWEMIHFFDDTPINDNNLSEYLNIAKNFSSVGKYYAATIVLNNILAFYPDFTLARLMLSDALKKDGSIEQARYTYRRYVEIMKLQNRGSSIEKRNY